MSAFFVFMYMCKYFESANTDRLKLQRFHENNLNNFHFG